MNPSKENKSESIKRFLALDSILEKKSSDKVANSTPTSNNTFLGPDIKGIEVPNDFRAQLFETKQVTNKPVKKEVVTEDKQEKLTILINKLALLLKEAKDIMSEMTTTGMIGTNQKFVLGQKKPKSKLNKYKLLFKGKK